jgi:hypothetical protein
VTPDILVQIAEEIADEPRFDTEGDWKSWSDGRWSLALTARLSVPESEFMPEETLWHLVVTSDSVFLYPDAEFGIKATFRHQDRSSPPKKGEPWRGGKPCLELSVASLARGDWDDEPSSLGPRMRWKLGRLLEWIDAAAADRLATVGDAFELPAGAGEWVRETFGFVERIEDADWWSASDDRWGLVSISELPVADHTSAVRAFTKPDGHVLREIDWSPFITSATARLSGIWLKLDTLPVLPPWQIPGTWAELSGALARQGIDLGDILAKAGTRYRNSGRPTRDQIFFLGFPIAARLGEPPERIHWFALKLHLAGRTEKRLGFRPREESRRTWDRQLARSGEPLIWLRTQNWAPDQLRSRGEADLELRAMRTLIIGCGALGSMVAENLARIGVTNLTLLDGEDIVMGNLCRHALGMSAIGRNKARALSWVLASTLPDVAAVAIGEAFPPAAADARARLRDADLVIDCTASDDVLDAMSEFEWGGDKLFVSLSITWGATGLFAYRASEVYFPALDAKARFRATPSPDDEFTEARPEAIGCWHPVFPASADDVSLWAAIGTRAIRRAVSDRGRHCDIYQRRADGSVERHDG